MAEAVLDRDQPLDLGIDGVSLGAEQVTKLGTRFVGDEELPHLGKREVDLLSGDDDGELHKHVGLETPPQPAAIDRPDQALALVETQGRGGEAACLGDLANVEQA